MSQIIAVGIGGFIGATSRYFVGLKLVDIFSKSFTPTLVINIIGCILFGYFVNHSFITESNYPLKEFILIGILGGFTTFSTFGFEFISLIQKGQQQMAFIYIGLSIILGGIGLYLGISLNRLFS